MCQKKNGFQAFSVLFFRKDTQRHCFCSSDCLPVHCENCGTEDFSLTFQTSVKDCIMSCKQTLDKIEEAKKEQGI